MAINLETLNCSLISSSDEMRRLSIKSTNLMAMDVLPFGWEFLEISLSLLAWLVRIININVGASINHVIIRL